MPDLVPDGNSATTSLRLDTLVRLRWLAVSGQAAAVAVVTLGLGFPFAIVECSALIALSALVNIALRIRYPATTRLGNTQAMLLLGYDVLQLTALLYLTGGLDNPFAVLLLVPLIVSATTLGLRPTIMLGLLISAAATVLVLTHQPLPWFPGAQLEFPLIYKTGVWVALVSASVFTAFYVFRVAEEARQLGRALGEAERVLAREQQLHALDGLAAAAAHELGTPLATIALVSKELERDLPPDSALADDIALLKSQSQRCRDILARLTSMSGEEDDHLVRLPLIQLVEEVAEPYRAFATEIAVDRIGGVGPEPIGERNPGIVQGLANLVENAVDFAESRVVISAEWNTETIAITVTDDGPGFAFAILERLGDPYLTTRPATRPDGTAANGDDGRGGLGLGVFIAKTLLERSGARLELTNLRPPRHGASVRVSWPRHVMDTA